LKYLTNVEVIDASCYDSLLNRRRINLIEIINKVCGLDIHKLFFITTILYRSGEKQQQCFDRTDDDILAFKKWTISKKCNVVACESTSDFWFPIYDSL